MTTLKKTKGSDSERKVLEHAHRGLQLLTEYKPKLMGKVQAFMGEAMQPGLLDKKEKERIALGMAMTQQCHYCIALHVRACKLAGVTVEEIMEVCGVAKCSIREHSTQFLTRTEIRYRAVTSRSRISAAQSVT